MQLEQGQEQKGQGVAVATLFTAATVWGLAWYPYRVLEQAGMSGALATAATYTIALLVGLALLWRRLEGLRPTWGLAAMALVAGGCNLGYVLAVLHGEVMRVLLLFYLSPLWTVLLARLLLGEKLSSSGGAVVGCAFIGAMVMLWHPALGLPWPRNGAEWIGLGAGICFALQNVMIRRLADHPVEHKTVTVFAGVVAAGFAVFLLGGDTLPPVLDGVALTTLLLIGLVLMVANLVVQVGLSALAANRAIVILLFELVVAALSSWFLAGEMMGLREWLGGGLIVAASLLSGRLEGRNEGVDPAP